MCGILGILNKNPNDAPNAEIFEKASSFLKYRGPDYKCTRQISTQFAEISLHHSRLSIIDLSEGGNQPMSSPSSRTIITFNGEIYNYLEIKNQLRKEGARFQSSSDTEVILSAYETWGIEKTLENLDGMFAFAIWDNLNGHLVIARDRFGKKPIYYHVSSNKKTAIFSSDIRSIQTLANASFTLDYHALGYYLAELATPEENSIWEEVKKLQPGHYAIMDVTSSKLNFVKKQYWHLNHTGNCTLSRAEIIEQTDVLIAAAVKKRLVADVRVAALLSGGIDSTLVVAKMADLMSDPVNTYTVGYAGHSFDESKYAKQVSQKFGTKHTELFLEPVSLDTLDDLIYEFGEPFADSSMIPTYLISKQISRFEKVVLGGDGGDEWFCGYDSYYKVYKLEQVKKFKQFYCAAKLLSHLYPSYRSRLLLELIERANQPNHRLLNREMGFNEIEISQLLGNDQATLALETEHKKIYNHSTNPSRKELLRIMNASLHTRLVNDYLVKVDRASMFASIEMRTPFLDKDLSLFASQLKPNQLYHRGEPKSILKDILKKSFDNDFINRKKMGFGIPIGDWFKTDFIIVINDVLSGNDYPVKFNTTYLKQFLNDSQSESSENTHKLWAVYVLLKWLKK
jgi:asparagine synthase (glutamine-hydrolysing)